MTFSIKFDTDKQNGPLYILSGRKLYLSKVMDYFL